MFIRLEQLKLSPFYQFIFWEGFREGFEESLKHISEERRKELLLSALAKLFRRQAAILFPNLRLGDEVESVKDLDKLAELFIDLGLIYDEADVRRRLAELAVKH